jgi:SAM-dependent methyltransferase
LPDEQQFRAPVDIAEDSIAELEGNVESRLLWPGRILKRGVRRALSFILGPQLVFNRGVARALRDAGDNLADQANQLSQVSASLDDQKRTVAEAIDGVARQLADLAARVATLEDTTVRSDALESIRSGLVDAATRVATLEATTARSESVQADLAALQGTMARNETGRIETDEGLRTSIQSIEGFFPSLMEDITSDFAEIRAVQASIGRQIDEVGGELVANTIDVKRLGKKHEDLAVSTTDDNDSVTSRVRTLETRFEPLMDLDHFDFASTYRGNEADITARLEKYARNYGDVRRVFDFGCGRGEFLRVCSRLGIGAYGLDRDADMISHCKLHGLEVVEGDALEHLRGLPSRSLDGIFSSQVVEHLTPAEIREMVELASDKLKRGAKIIIETINPDTLSAMRWFYLDPSHSQPVPADMLRFFLQEENFEVLDTLYTSPVPEDERLSFLKIATPIEGSLPADFLELTNDNVRRLNELLFGCQDYAIIAQR